MVKKYQLLFTKQAQKDAKKVSKNHLKENAQKILDLLEQDPFLPPYEALVGKLTGAYSRRINIQHRIVYKVNKRQKIVTILRMWTHYDD
ncbi:MAG: Txe/YoeB family addiction module toxin [Verrucomicrobia bacterium]|nr:MAG: Txe/YoeB family addiction module toxin [Verrucomicrobiota bacterium]